MLSIGRAKHAMDSQPQQRSRFIPLMASQKEVTLDQILTFLSREWRRKPFQVGRRCRQRGVSHDIFQNDDLLVLCKARALKGLYYHAKEFQLIFQPVRSHGWLCCFVFKIPVLFFLITEVMQVHCKQFREYVKKQENKYFTIPLPRNNSF